MAGNAPLIPTADLHSLAARAEAAEGPDRALDAEIEWTVLGETGSAYVTSSHYRSGFSHVSGWWTDAEDRSHCAPKFTASLDAALTLASDFTEVQLWNLWNEALCQCSKAEASLRDDLARFVVAACLRARATQGENDAHR